MGRFGSVLGRKWFGLGSLKTHKNSYLTSKQGYRPKTSML
jgi:hypothetical protein